MKTKLTRLYAKARARQPRLWTDHNGRQWRDLDETIELEPAPLVGRWSVLTVAPRMEAQAAEALQDAGYIAWYPQTVETAVSSSRRTRTKVNRPLFPRYVFAAAGEVSERQAWPDKGSSRLIGRQAYEGRLSGEDWMRRPEAVGMLDCDHVVRIIACTSQALLDELSRRQAGGEFEVPDKIKAAFAKGSKVRLTDGPFAGFDGIVHRSVRERIEVLVQLFGRTTKVQFEASQVEAA